VRRTFFAFIMVTHLHCAETQPYILGILQDDVQKISIPRTVVVAYIDSHCLERAEQVLSPEPESSWLAEAFQALQPGLGPVPSSIARVSSSINVSRNREALFFGVKVPHLTLHAMYCLTLFQALAQEEKELPKQPSSAAAFPLSEWFDRVLVPFTSAEVPNEGGSAFGVERAIRAVTIAFWSSLLLNFRRALKPSTGVVNLRPSISFMSDSHSRRQGAWI
jgi:hypothetical protein